MTVLKSVWIVNHYAGGPEIGTGWRHYELARRWGRLGVETTVFTASTKIGGETGAAREGPRRLDGVVFRFIAARKYGGNGIARVLNLFDFARGAEGAMREELDLGARPDAVLASSPQPFVWPGARRISARARALFVPEIRDIWPESLQEIGGMPAWHPLVLACRIARSRALGCADLVFSPLSHIDRYAAAHGVAKDRCIVVPNGVDGEIAARATPLPRAASGSPTAARRRLLYAGAMGLPNALHGMLDAVALLCPADRARLHILMAGDGTQRERLAARVARECPESVELLGSLEQRGVETLAMTCHGAIINWLPKPLYRFGISPQKVPLYLALGLPIVSASPDEEDPVRRESLGWWSRAGDARALCDSLRAFLDCDSAGLAAISLRCTEYAQTALNWDSISLRALEALQRARSRQLAG